MLPDELADRFDRQVVRHKERLKVHRDEGIRAQAHRPELSDFTLRRSIAPPFDALH